MGGTLGGFFRGQLLVALLMGLASMLGFWFVGLPFFALMGALTGLFALVPLIGTIIVAIPVLFVAATAGDAASGVLRLHGGWPLSIASVLVLVLVQQLDTRLLSQRLVKRDVRLHPVTVLLSLLVGGTLMGLWGMLLAVPTTAVLKVLVLHLWDTRGVWPPNPSEPPGALLAGTTDEPVTPDPDAQPRTRDAPVRAR
jgi:predicted PurR-regulated permease PerM